MSPFPFNRSSGIVDATGQTFVATLQPAGRDPGARTPVAGRLAVVHGRPEQRRGCRVATFAGCTLNGSAPGAVLVASAPGLAPASTAPFAVGSHRRRMTLAAPAGAITWGQGVQLTAALVRPAPKNPVPDARSPCSARSTGSRGARSPT